MKFVYCQVMITDKLQYGYELTYVLLKSIPSFSRFKIRK